MKKILHAHRQGFTLIELLLSIGLSLVIFTAVTAFMFLLFTSNTRVKQADSFSNIKHTISTDMTATVQWAKAIEIAPTNDAFTVTGEDDQTITYSIDHNQLKKNTTVMHPNSVEITSFSVTDYGAGSRYSLEILIGMRNKQYKALSDTMKVIVSQRKYDAQNE